MAVLNIKNGSRIGLILLFALWLGACGNESSTGAGEISLSITDAPVDGAEHVVVEFTGIEIQSDSGRHTINYFSPKTIDLLALQGGLSEFLLEDYVLPEGNVSWIRLKVNAEADGVIDSYIDIIGSDTMPDGRYELYIPSGSKTGLKLIDSFHVADGANLDFTIDFDLRKSVHQPRGQEFQGVPVYFLRPTLRLVETVESGTISGLIDPLTLTFNECSNSVENYAVYLYKGDVTPDDIDGIEPDPVSTAAVTLNASNEYAYTLAFLEVGNYTIAFTCDADLDEPDTDNSSNTGNRVVIFVGTAAVSVTAGATTPHNF
jgi:hypothetical protein